MPPTTCRPQSFDLDVAALERNFKRMQRAVHPDHFGRRTPREREMSQSVSSCLNVAYHVLRSPPSRAQYLLQLHGLDPIGETSGSVGVDPDLLATVMEWRESIEDPATPPADIEAIRAAAHRECDELVGQLGDAFRSGNLGAACRVVVRLQYMTRVQQEAEETAFLRLAAKAGPAA